MADPSNDLRDTQAEASLWERVGEIVVEALQRQGEARLRYVVQATGADAELRRQVEDYLASYAKADSDYLEEPLFRVQPEDPTLGVLGRRMGPYSLQRLLGHGGMGAVYLAQRVDGAYSRRVAIKLVGMAMDRNEVVQGLERERQILARLDHPNIAQLLDAGATEEGWPYFVMEYIDGQTLDAYCRERRPTLNQRVTLMRKVCAAVQYAHQNLVIHRDLKPGNILVDAHSEPHLLDFGIAKILRPGPQPTVTARGQRPMTLRYASPEQLLYRPVTVASDIYSLGLILWELLTGRQAVDPEGLSPGEVERLICETDLPLPSEAALAPPTDPQAGIAAVRDRKRWASRLQGDLDTITMMALRKEPKRRFPSVERFADDLKRSQEGLPVKARKATLPYRASKFLQRHAAAVATVAFVVILTLGFMLRLLQQRTEITQQRDAAQLLSEEVALERDSAEEVTQFLLRLFQGADPKEGKRYEITALEMLDEGAAKVQELDVKPLVKANLMSAIASSYYGMGLFAKAADLWRQALDLRRSVLDEDDLLVGELLHEIAATHEKRGLYHEAERLFGQALEIFERELEPNDITIAFNVDFTAAVFIKLEKYDQAEAYFQRARGIKEVVYGRQHRTYAGALNNLSALYWTLGRYREAEALLRESLEIVLDVLGPDHPDRTLVEGNLARVWRLQGRLSEAQPLLERSLEVRTREYGPDHPLVVGATNELGMLFWKQGRSAEAEALFLKSLDVCARTLRPDHPRASDARLGLARSYLAQGKLEASASALDQVLQTLRRNFGSEHSEVAVVLALQAEGLWRSGQAAAAEDLYRRALEMHGETLGAGHPVRASMLDGYASLLESTHRIAEAAAVKAQADSIRSRPL